MIVSRGQTAIFLQGITAFTGAYTESYNTCKNNSSLATRDYYYEYLDIMDTSLA